MEDITPIAAAEVVGILYNSATSVVSKIPFKILETLEDESDFYEEKDNLIQKISLNNYDVSDEAKAIIAILYKDYLCESEEEKTQITSAFVEGQNEHEMEMQEKYSPFKETTKSEIDIKGDEQISTIVESDVTALTLPKKWYTKLFDKLKSFFK